MTSKMKHKVFHPDHEVIGQMIQGFTNAIGNEQFQDLIKKYGYQSIEPEQWYDCQHFLNFQDELAEKGMLDLVSVGMSVGMNVHVPPEFETLPIAEIIKLIPLAYSMNNRGTNIGTMTAEVLTDYHVKFVLKNPHSDDGAYGSIYALVKRFALPRGYRFKVYYDKDKPRRDEGGEETIIHVEWWEKEDK